MEYFLGDLSGNIKVKFEVFLLAGGRVGLAILIFFCRSFAFKKRKLVCV